MPLKRVSVAGACSLLGQHLLAKLHEDTDFIVESLHDNQATASGQSLTEVQSWQVAPELQTAYAQVPFLSADAPARAPVLLSFLPDDGSAETESAHLARGTRVVTHCEYARLTVPLIMPDVTAPHADAMHLATPNCTTAMCALPLYHLHKAYGITGVTITALQAISGTDLPGLAASAIHDQVIGHLPGEADALSSELSVLLGDTFPINTFATRVPIWRGHTITLSIDLKGQPDLKQISATLGDTPEIALTGTPIGRDRFSAATPLTTITDIRKSATGVLLVIKGDNLEAATTGIMQSVARNF